MKPKKGDMFACTQGTYIGSNLILINEQDKVYNFLNVPDMKNVEIPIDEVKLGVENDILELLDSLPQYIIKICEAQYEKNINTR